MKVHLKERLSKKTGKISLYLEIYKGYIKEEGKIPETYILKEDLDLKRDERIPHIYGEYLKRNKIYIRICTFLPAEDWNNEKNISDTLIFWALEWIYYFEIWNVCGVWKRRRKTS